MAFKQNSDGFPNLTTKVTPTTSDIVMIADAAAANAPNQATVGSLPFVEIAGDTMTGALILNADPATALGAATKQYVDNVAVVSEIKASVICASTVALTAIYANGALGVGATLTNNAAQAAFSTDGISPAINSRVLIKNQASTFQNGIYTLTTVGSGASNWVLTRATDYDVIAEVAPGNVVVVETGTLNAVTQWMQSATVAAMGTDPILFTQFGASLPFVEIAGDTMTGALILNADPATALGAATKQYVDTAITNISIKSPVVCATTVALTAVYANGALGVGATLTNSGVQAAFSTDGISPAINSRILVKNQASTSQNGIYTLTTVGSGATNWVLTRATDYDVIAEVVIGTVVVVETGTAANVTQWMQTQIVGIMGTDAISFTQFGQNSLYVLKAGDTMTGALILNADPVVALGAVTKQYVDAIASGLTIKSPVICASTTAFTVTYANGASGVGATLTNAGVQAAFSTDGISPAINSRVLIKDQASQLQNGIYTLTTVGSGATNWVLTRATDFDAVAEIILGSIVIVQTGTANANTSWIETATVATIGVDSITFSQFGSSTKYKQTEVDFGSTPVDNASFTITDAQVTASSIVSCWLSGATPTSKDQDELEMDALFMEALPGAGSFSLYIRGLEGYVSDKFKINYLIN